MVEVAHARPAHGQAARPHREEMGKNFSGTGVDTNIIGRLRITGEPEMESPRIRYVSVLDLSEASHGNATGVGLVDF